MTQDNALQLVVMTLFSLALELFFLAFITLTFLRIMGQLFYRIPLSLGSSHGSSWWDLVMYFCQGHYPVVCWSQLVPAMEASSHVSSQSHVLWCHIYSLKSAKVAIFTPWKSTNATVQGSPLPPPHFCWWNICTYRTILCVNEAVSSVQTIRRRMMLVYPIIDDILFLG